MEGLGLLARALIALGLLLVIMGLGLLLLPRILPSGRLLPGDIVYRSDKVTVYFPIATSLLLSLLVSLLLSVFWWLRAKW